MFSSAQIVSVRRILFDELESTFSDLSLSTLPNIASAFDDYLLAFLRQTLPDYLKCIITGAAPAERSQTYHTSRVRFDFTVDRDFASADTAVVSFMEIPEHRKPPKVSQRSKTLISRGLFNRARVYYSRSLPIDSDAALLFVATVFEEGNRWLDDKIAASATEQETMLADDIYSFWRRVARAGELQQHVWFAAATKGASFALFDRAKVAEAIDNASLSASRFHTPPLRIVSEMLTYCVPFDTVAAKVSISRRRPIEIDLSQSAFRTKYPELAEAEMINLGGPAICVFPLAQKGESCLVAGFPLTPQDRCEALYALMQQHHGELKTLFFRRLKDLNFLWRIANRRMRSANKLRESERIQESASIDLNASTSDATQYKEELLEIVKSVVQHCAGDEERFNKALEIQAAICRVVLSVNDRELLATILTIVRSESTSPPFTPNKLERWLKAFHEV